MNWKEGVNFWEQIVRLLLILGQVWIKYFLYQYMLNAVESFLNIKFKKSAPNYYVIIDFINFVNFSFWTGFDRIFFALFFFVFLLLLLLYPNLIEFSVNFNGTKTPYDPKIILTLNFYYRVTILHRIYFTFYLFHLLT